MDFAASPFQIKSLDDAGVIEGIGAFFGNVDMGGDIIAPGAFTKTLAERGGAPIPMLFAHKLDRPIGAWTEAKETDEGLAVKGRITLASRDGAEAYALAKDGALTGLSVGYLPVRKSHSGANRLLQEVNLFEVSPVPVPMNERARVRSVKSVQSIRDLEDLLRDEGGFSNRRAKLAASVAWKALNETENEDAELAELSAIIGKSAARLSQIGRR